MIKKGFFRLTLSLILVVISTVSCLDVSVRLLKVIHMLSVEEGETLEIDLMSYVFPAHIEESIEFEILRGVGEIEDTKYVFSPDYDSSGVYEVELQASTSDQTDTRVFSVRVLDKNRAPSIEIPNQSISTEESLDLDLMEFSVDPDGDTLSFSLVSGVGGIQGSNYSFTASEVYVGENEVTISVSDGKGGSDSSSFLITVFRSNEPPQLDVPDQSINEGESLSIDLLEYSNDPDGDALSFELISGVGAVTGTSYEYTSNYESEGVYQITIGVVDTKGATSSDQFQLTVINENRKPSIPTDPIPANNETDVATGSSLAWSCSDPDDDTLQYDVYFGKTENPSLVAEGIQSNSFAIEGLECDTVYYWKIIASDGEEITEGPLWSFKTTTPPVFLEIAVSGSLAISPIALLNGVERQFPITYEGYKNESVSIDVPKVQLFDSALPAGDDVRLEFLGWSDGEDNSVRSITLKESMTLLVDFDADYYVSITSNLPVDLGIIIEGADWYGSGEKVTIAAPKVDNFSFDRWIMNGEEVVGRIITFYADGPTNLLALYTHDCP